MPVFIKAFSPFLDVTVFGSQIFGAFVDSTATSSFWREELVKLRIALAECDVD
jgi:hypothetical protein